mmetsp:Transcript_28907/g.81403  ORF Transcript_28907/g.81403 Transcript_28907/m.81403 type:complete len:291 (-) Transcript_28907:2470-3342(-)
MLPCPRKKPLLAKNRAGLNVAAGPGAGSLVLELMLNLGQHVGLVDVHLLGVLQKALAALGLAGGGEVLLAVEEHRVHVGLVADGKLKGTVPLEEGDGHLDGPEGEDGLQEDLLSQGGLPLEQSQLRSPPLFCRHVLDVQHVLQLVHLLHRAVGHLCGVELPGVDGHGSQAAPQRGVLHKAAQTRGLLPLARRGVAVQHKRVGGRHARHAGAVGAADDGPAAREALQGRQLAGVGQLLLHAGHCQQVAVREHHLGVIPHRQAAVYHGHQHVRLVVPQGAVHHCPQLHQHSG